jgi:hypothetical protein
MPNHRADSERRKMTFAECFSQHFDLNLFRGSMPGMPEVTLSGLLSGVGVVGFFLAVILSPLGQLAYSLRLRRLVKLHQREDAPASLWMRRGARLRAPLAAQRLKSLPLVEASRSREQRIRRATWISYAVFVVYGFCAFQAVKTDRAFADSLLILGFLTGMAFGPAAVNVTPYGLRRTLALVPLVLVAAWNIVEPLSAHHAALAVGILLSLHMITVHRTMRAVVLPLAVLCVSMGVLLGAGMWLFLADAMQCRLPTYAPDDYQYFLGVIFSIAVVCMVLALCVGILVLQAIVRIVERGWLSDISLVAASGVIALGGFLTIGVQMRTTPAMAALLFCGWIALTLGTYVMVLRARSYPADSSTLLILRVFSYDSTTERLLDGVQNRWRLTGPVLEMGGPDLARINLELRGFLKFLSLGLHEILHPRGGTESAFRSSLDLAIDREGRFRINELFSFNSSWRSVLEHLLLITDVVLLDLRGFNPKREGTTYEVQRLCALGRMGRVVAVYDAHTDWAHFDAIVSQAGALQGVPKRVDASSKEALPLCMEGLFQLAELSRSSRLTPAEADHQPVEAAVKTAG